jgi:1,4-dihydroxy-2-naphthoate octaprenyltransferase
MNSNKAFLWFDSSTLKHLRFPFSIFLLPVFLFALSQMETINWGNTILAFFLLHVFIFPSSNGYNSFQDKDESSIGGLKNPPKVNRNLYHLTFIFDALAVLLGLIISVEFSLLLSVFILMSRAYSYRKIRLKKYPIVGYITVFIFQGGFIFLTSAIAISGFSISELWSLQNIICMSISSLFIGSMYPLTQIYQHESDKKDGVTSISYLLGYRGTFIFSGLLFILGTVLMVFLFWSDSDQLAIFIFLPFIFTMSLFMSKWFRKVKQDITQANFENTMTMNRISSLSMNLYFLILIMINNI